MPPQRIFSFGYKHHKSPPTGSNKDLVIDVRRALPNPYRYHPNQTGKDEAVQKFFWGFDEIHVRLDAIAAQVARCYTGDVYIGCVGGKHRSVFVAEDMARRFSRAVEHLDIDKP